MVNKVLVRFNFIPTQGQFDALFDIGYNAGAGAVIHVLDKSLGSYEDSFMHYVHDAHGNILPGLVTRRQQDITWWNS